jgi:membrane-bound ClpP family serine protease
LERALSILKSWRLLLMVTGVGLLLAGLYSHNQAIQVAGFIVAIFGAFGGG